LWESPALTDPFERIDGQTGKHDKSNCNAMEINSHAPVITRDEILIHAPIETIWAIQTDVNAWPSRQPDVDSAQADGPLAVGSVFH
jgi:hypothetical protein